MGRVLREELLKYNDYELLYLANLDGEEAQTILFDKYLFMIKKLISKFDILPQYRDDYEQEGLLMINKAIKTYKTNSQMSFTKYVEMLIYRRFIDLERSRKRKQEEIILDNEIDYIIDQPREALTLQENLFCDLSVLSEVEKKVYELKYIHGKSNKKIALELQMNISQVYSASDRIKKKLKLMIKTAE